MADQHRMFIDGQWVEGHAGRTFAVRDPATGESIAEVADGGAAEATRAVEVAARAFPAWAATPARERAPVLHRIQALMEARRDDLARLVTRENGKPFGGVAARGRLRPGLLRLVRRGGAAHVRGPRALAVPGQAALGRPPAGRRGGGDHPVELPGDDGVRDEMRVCREEIFGPVAPVLTFGSEAELIARANDTQYGLAAYLYARDLGRVTRVAEALQYGLIGVNDAAGYTHEIPFGGFKESGIGREGGREGIHEYMEVKSVVVSLPALR